MTQVMPITPEFAVSRALEATDFADLAAQGFRTIINFLPDSEASPRLPASEARHLCEAAGMTFAHVPARKFDLFTEDVVASARDALQNASGPILAYCASGQRAAIVWAAAAADRKPVDTILGALANAGFDLGYIRDDLESQADRARWQQQPTAFLAASAA